MANKFTSLCNHVSQASKEKEAHYADFTFKRVDNVPFDYVTYEVAGKPMIGTAIRYTNSSTAQAALEATSPAFSLRYESDHCLIYGDLLIDINDWISQFISDWNERFRVLQPTDAEVNEAGNTIVDLFCKVTKEVRQQLISGGKAFVKIEECFGLTENNEVKLIRAPTGTSFHTTILDLGKFAKKLKDQILLKIGATKSTDAVKLLVAFEKFLIQYVTLSNIHVKSSPTLATIDFLALHHPTSLDNQQTLILFQNLGGLCKGQMKLCSNIRFQKYIASNFSGRDNKMCQESCLRTVFNHPRENSNQGNYKPHEVAIFCLNALKHYGQPMGLKSSKANVLEILCGQVDDLAHHLFSAYADSVVMGSYNHSLFPHTKLFTTNI